MKNCTFIIATDPNDCRDKRYKYLADSIRKDGYELKFWQGEDIMAENCLLILPFDIEDESAYRLMEKLPERSLAVGGVLQSDAASIALTKKIKYKNILLDEKFCLQNAIPTAEGALKTAMEMTEQTINSSRCALFGYGRIGKRLAELMRDCGAKVKIFSSSKGELELAALRGFNAINLAELEKSRIDDADILINTIPLKFIINERLISRLKDTCVIIDLASGANNVDWNFAIDRGHKNCHATGLPGKVAPLSAAEYIKQVIYRFCECNL